MKKDRQMKTHPERPLERGGRFWLDGDDSLRRWLKLLAALAAVLSAAWAAPLLLTALFQALFAAWGVNGETVARAPGWARGLFNGWLYVNGTVQGAAIALAAVWIGSALGERVRMGKGLWMGLIAGALAAVVLIVMSRLLDVMRFGHALSSPDVSGLTAALTMYLLAQALGAALATGLIGQILSGWHRYWGYLGCAALYALLFGRWTAIGVVNSALFGLLLWHIREKNGGVAPAFGFLAVFSVLTVAVLGMPPWQQGALYETYHVSKPWLTGGNMGPWAGLAMTVLLVFIAVSALPNRKK
jgi:hypothetical protein